MRDKDTSALRDMYQYSSLAEKPFDQWEIATHKRTCEATACDPHLNQTKLNDLLPLTNDGVLIIPSRRNLTRQGPHLTWIKSIPVASGLENQTST